jgi:hypothetical protein
MNIIRMNMNIMSQCYMYGNYKRRKCHQVNARRREKHKILLSDDLVTIAVDRWRAQLSMILDDPLHAQK